MLKGMTIDQFKLIVAFVQDHHAFAKWKSREEREIESRKFPSLPEYGFNIKYIDCCYDTRDSDVWMVKFRGGIGADLAFSTNHFNALSQPPENFTYTSLFNWVMGYLKGEWDDEKILKTCAIKKEK